MQGTSVLMSTCPTCFIGAAYINIEHIENMLHARGVSAGLRVVATSRQTRIKAQNKVMETLDYKIHTRRATSYHVSSHK